MAVPPEPSEVVPEAAEPAVIVNGYRRSYADGIRLKRTAIAVSDSISSDGLGRFPDLNVGEAVQRITGVQINREVEARNATINLRGLPGTFARTTLNGQSFAEPILDSSTPLGAFNSDIFSAISIIKSPGANNPSGGLSGIIDLRIQPAGARKPGGFAKFAYEYNTLGGTTSPAVSVSYTVKPTADLAVFGAVAVKQERFRRDSINFSQYTPLAANTPGFATVYASYYAPFQADGSCLSGDTCAVNGTGALDRRGVLFPSDIRQISKYNEGWLISAAGGVEYRPSDRIKLTTNGFFSRRTLDQNAMDMIEVDLRPLASTVAPTTSVSRLPDGSAFVDRFSFDTPQVNLSARSEPTTQQVWSLDSQAQWRGGDWTWTGTVVLSQARNYQEQTQVDWRTAARPGTGLSGAFYSGGEDIGGYALALNSADIRQTFGPWTWLDLANPAFQQNALGDQVVVAGSSGYAENHLSAVQLDLDRRVSGWIDSVSGGVRLEEARFLSRGYRTSAKGVQGDALGDGLLHAGVSRDFFGGVAPGYLEHTMRVDYDYALSRLRPVTVGAGDTLTETGWINDATNGSYSAANFTVTHRTASAYAQMRSIVDLQGVPVTSLIGVRLEDTQKAVNVLNRRNAEDGSPSYDFGRFTTSYRQWLPSVLIAANLRDDLVLRFAAYKTYAQPQPRNLSPATTVTANSNGFSIAYGGYDLKPYTAVSQDVSLEWYNRPGSLVSLAIYRKRVTNFVASESRLERLCPEDATAFGLGHLRLEGEACLSDILINGRPAIITASGNYNSGNPIIVDGVEFSIQQNFDFLPGAWRHFGGLFNASLTRISGRNADGSAPVLPGVSDRTYNLIGYYETPKWGARLIYNYRDEYVLAGVSTFTGGSSRVKARGQVDASASIVLTPRYSLSLDAYNLGDARRSQYQRDARLPRANDYDGRTFTLNLRTIF
nr:TonB-dependent receptor [Asticcacaulis solisilvae]